MAVVFDSMTQIAEPVSTPEPVVVTAQAEPKVFEPYFVKVKDDVAQIVGRAGDTVLYIEAKISELSQGAKVWVLGNVESLKRKAEPYTQPLLSKLSAAIAEAKEKAGTTLAPLYAKVVDGAIYIQGKVGNFIITVKAKAMGVWMSAAVRMSMMRAMVREEADKRLTPLMITVNAKYAVAKEKAISITTPYWLKAQDGTMYLRMQAGNTVVYIRTGLSDASDRVSKMSISAYNKAHEAISYYADPIIARAVAIYQKVDMKIRATLTPLAQELKNRAVNMKIAILGVAAQVRVRAVAARNSAADFSSECYVKFKDGFIYVQGRVDDKIVTIRVRLQEIARVVHEKMAGIRAEAQTQLFALTNYAKKTSAPLIDRVRVAAADKEVQVTAASAVGGAAALGASGGATGLVTGGAIGAACGVVPALFTFGLSIPIGAVLGGTVGLVGGTVAGGTVGLVGGGAAGRSAHKHRAEIKEAATGALSRASSLSDFVTEKTERVKHIATEKASDYKDYVKVKTEHVRTRLVGGTGGSF